MQFCSKRIVGAIAAAMTISAVGCNVPPTRIAFIEKIALDNRKIARSTRAFHSAIIPLKKNEAVDAGKVRAAYQEMEKTVKEVQAEMEIQLPPSSSSSGAAFLSAYKEYLKGEQQILTDILQPIVKKVEEPGGSLPEKWAFIDGVVKQSVAKENADYALLLKAQTDFASEHNYTVQSMEAYFKAQAEGKQ